MTSHAGPYTEIPGPPRDAVEILDGLRDLPGLVLGCVLDPATGRVLAGLGSDTGAAALLVDWARRAGQVATQRGHAVEDVIVTSASSYHLVRETAGVGREPVWVYLQVDRERGNLALARRRLATLGRSVVLDRSTRPPARLEIPAPRTPVREAGGGPVRGGWSSPAALPAPAPAVPRPSSSPAALPGTARSAPSAPSATREPAIREPATREPATREPATREPVPREPATSTVPTPALRAPVCPGPAGAIRTALAPVPTVPAPPMPGTSDPATTTSSPPTSPPTLPRRRTTPEPGEPPEPPGSASDDDARPRTSHRAPRRSLGLGPGWSTDRDTLRRVLAGLRRLA